MKKLFMIALLAALIAGCSAGARVDIGQNDTQSVQTTHFV